MKTLKHSITVACLEKDRRWQVGVKFTDKAPFETVRDKLIEKLQEYKCYDGAFRLVVRRRGGYSLNHKTGSTSIISINGSFERLCNEVEDEIKGCLKVKK